MEGMAMEEGWTGNDGFERDFLCEMLEIGVGEGGLAFGLELAVDGYVGILVETGVWLEAGFGLGTAFEDRIIMVQETRAPLECSKGVVMLECMSLALGFFDEFTVGYAGCGPVFREMVGIEFEESGAETRGAYDDAFFAGLAFFDHIHGAPEHVDARIGTEIAHAFGVRSGSRR